MSRRPFLVSGTTGERNKVISFYLNIADSYQAHFADVEELSSGRADFLHLHGTSVRPWEGMESSIEVCGPLTREARELFLRSQDRDVSGYPTSLWDYALSIGDDVVLLVQDFHVCIVFVTSHELRGLRKMHIRTGQWEQVDMRGYLAHNEKVVPISDVDSEILQTSLSEVL